MTYAWAFWNLHSGCLKFRGLPALCQLWELSDLQITCNSLPFGVSPYTHTTKFLATVSRGPLLDFWGSFSPLFWLPNPSHLSLFQLQALSLQLSSNAPHLVPSMCHGPRIPNLSFSWLQLVFMEPPLWATKFPGIWDMSLNQTDKHPCPPGVCSLTLDVVTIPHLWIH